MLVAPTALAGREIELEVDVATRGLCDRSGSRLGQRSAPQVGVDDDAGAVEDAARPRAQA